MSDEPLHEKMSKASAEAVGDLIRQHWPAIEAIAGASGKSKAAVAISIKFERVSADSTKVITSLRYAEKHADEREDYVETEDPKQAKIKLS
jgi:hypothetical protein